MPWPLFPVERLRPGLTALCLATRLLRSSSSVVERNEFPHRRLLADGTPWKSFDRVKHDLCPACLTAEDCVLVVFLVCFTAVHMSSSLRQQPSAFDRTSIL